MVAMALILLAPIAKASQPTLIRSFSDQVVTSSTPSIVDLKNYLKADPSTNMVRVTTSLTGSNGVPLGFTLQLFPSNAPATVANFLEYINNGAYTDSLIHRVYALGQTSNNQPTNLIVQAGGFQSSNLNDLAIYETPTLSPIALEYALPNAYGTIAMARTADPNSATSQFFINDGDNSDILGTNNGGGYAVFGQVIGNGMSVVDKIAALTTYNLQGIYTNFPFSDTPLFGITNGQSILNPNNLVYFTRIATIPYFATSSDPSSYQTLLSNSTLTITCLTNHPASPSTISIYATDTNGLFTNTSFQVWNQTNANRPINYPIYSNQPYSPNGFDMPFYPTTSDGTPVPPQEIHFSDAVFSGYTNGYNHFNFVGAGTVSFTYVQPGNFFYKAVTNTSTFIVSKGSQTITFPPIATNGFSTNPFTFSDPPTASSGLPVSVTIQPNSPLKVVNNKFVMTGLGNVTLVANQAGNNNYLPASSVSNSFLIVQGSQSITFPTIRNIPLPSAPFKLNATASSGLPVSYALVGSNNPATLTNGNTLKINAPGLITIVANQAGTNLFSPAPPVTNSFRSGSNQTIAPFARIAGGTYVNPSTNLTIKIPKSSSGLPVVLSVKSGPAATNGSNSISITGAGTIVLAANQIGNSTYFAAPEVTTSIIVAKATQKIAPFSNLPTALTNGMHFTVIPPVSTDTNSPVTVVASGAGRTSSPNTVTLTNAGKLILTATNAGDSNYLPVSISTNLPVAIGNQTITFPSIDSQYIGTTLSLTATSSSRLPVTYSIKADSTNNILKSNAIILNGFGGVTVIAKQAGNSGWHPAAPVTNNFSVIPDPGSNGGGGVIIVNGNH
jgi:hypothetical protein